MEKTLIESIKYEDDYNGSSFLLKYFLVEEEIHGEEGFGICCYGIEIVKESADAAQSQSALSISCEKDKVLELIFRLIKGVVTPMTLCDIVYDALCETAYDENKTRLYNNEETPHIVHT